MNIQYGAEAKGVTGEQGYYVISLVDGTEVQARYIILGIGLQGNPRLMGIPSEECDLVQYTLDDPGEYQDEIIAVIGAGDAAIENAIALAATTRSISLIERTSLLVLRKAI